MIIPSYEDKDVEQILKIWNEIVESALAYPDEYPIKLDEAYSFFKKEIDVICAVDNDTVLGYYLIHPNGYGRRSHICNTTYDVRADMRGKGIGRELVLDSFKRCKDLGFKVLQYNGVVSLNEAALKLYRSLGITEAGIIKNGYRLKDGTYCDGIMFTKQL